MTDVLLAPALQSCRAGSPLPRVSFGPQLEAPRDPGPVDAYRSGGLPGASGTGPRKGGFWVSFGGPEMTQHGEAGAQDPGRLPVPLHFPAQAS